MEILQHSLKKVDRSSLNDFQKEILRIITNHFEGLMTEKISNDSIVEETPFLEIIIRLKGDSFVLSLSVRNDMFLLNSNYFDINIYPETRLDLVNLLVGEALLGNYEIILSYGASEKLVRKEIIFDNHELNEFNQEQKIGLFSKKVKRDEKKHGIQLIYSIP